MGIPIFVFVCFQMLLSSFGIECHNAWTVIWIITTIGGLILPILFYRHLKTLTENKYKNLKARLTFFNIIECTFIQASLGLFFSNGETLCHVSDGQNGIQFVFTGWLALPIIIGLSVLFNKTLKAQNEKNKNN